MASYHNSNTTINSVEGEQQPQEDSGQAAFFPHLLLSRDELDLAYPSLQAPEDFDATNNETEEPTLREGLKAATDIAEAMRVHGRTRRDRTGGVTSEMATSSPTTLQDPLAGRPSVTAPRGL